MSDVTDADVFGRLVDFRRSVRIFDEDIGVPAQVIERSLQRAVLSPNSSNLQLWEFYWVRSPEKKANMAAVCMGQNAAKTAQEFVVVVVRKDLWRKRCDDVIGQQVAHFKETFGEPLSAGQKRILMYWQKVIPLLYRSGFGVLDIGKRVVAWLRGFVAPTPREVSSGHMRIVAHRSVALAAMTFMHSVAAEGYDTCPMEGFDSSRLRALIGLPSSAEFSMVIAIGSRAEKGVYGPRLRVPIDEVVFEV